MRKYSNLNDLPHLAPHPDDIGDDKWNGQRHPGHHLEREQAGGAVVESQGILDVHCRDIIGRVVESGYEQNGPDCEQCAGAHDVEVLSDALAEEMPSKTCQHEDDTKQEDHSYPPGVQDVVQVLEGFGRDYACGGIHRIAGPEEKPEDESHEGQDECGGGDRQPSAAFIRKCAHIRLCQQVEQAEGAGREEHHHRVGEGIQAVPAVGPGRNGGRGGIGDGDLVHGEGTSGEKSADGHSEEEGAEGSVQEKENLEGAGSQDVAGRLAVFEGERLNDEEQQDADPQPVGSSEAGGIEQGEGGEGRSAEGDEGGEGDFPFVPGVFDYQVLLILRGSGAQQQSLRPLHEKQEYENRAEEGY